MKTFQCLFSDYDSISFPFQEQTENENEEEEEYESLQMDPLVFSREEFDAGARSDSYLGQN